MKLRLMGAVALAALVGVLAFASATAAAPPSTSTTSVSIPVNFSNSTGTFVGSFDITRFVNQNGVVSAVGTLTGTVTNALTGVTQTVTQDLVLPLLQGSGSCQVLHLELGPLDLNLLGVAVHLDKVVLDVTAQSGPGNLLGNLLCGVTHLLDSNGAATAVANLLNNLLGLV
jgi:hypothetical protein